MKDVILNGILFFVSVLPDIPFKMLNFAFVKDLGFRFSATCFRLAVRRVAVRSVSTVHASWGGSITGHIPLPAVSRLPVSGADSAKFQ